MIDGRVYFDNLEVADDLFTEEIIYGWERALMTAYETILHDINEAKDPSCQVALAMNPSLLDDSIVDAVLGLKKITQSTNNTVDEPNTFKIVAYIMYWFLRHKPIQVYCSEGVWIEDVFVSNSSKYSKEEFDKLNKELAWKIKHVNEYVAVAFCLSHIFDYDVVVLSEKDFKKLKAAQGDRIPFDSFEEMTDALVDKLIYYVSYRAIAPKILEHFLEGYTYYPNHGLTDEHWGF